jgi:F-box-like
MQGSGAERLPDEIILMIFRCLLSGNTKEPLLARLREGWYPLHKLKGIPISTLSKRRSFINVMVYKRHLLLSVLRVCRRWNEITNEILYRDIHVSGKHLFDADLLTI